MLLSQRLAEAAEDADLYHEYNETLMVCDSPVQTGFWLWNTFVCVEHKHTKPLFVAIMLTKVFTDLEDEYNSLRVSLIFHDEMIFRCLILDSSV